MKGKLLRICRWISVLALVSCASLSQKQRTGREQFALTQEQLKVVQARALKGEKRALRQMVNYWLFYENSPETAKPWIERAQKAGAIVVEP